MLLPLSLPLRDSGPGLGIALTFLDSGPGLGIAMTFLDSGPGLCPVFKKSTRDNIISVRKKIFNYVCLSIYKNTGKTNTWRDLDFSFK